MLADSYGVAPASLVTYRALTLLHPPPREVLPQDLIDTFGEPRPVNVDRATATIYVDKVRECIATTPPLTSPHRDGWRTESLEALARDEAFVVVLAVFITNVATANIPSSTADYLASATLVALLKKNEEDT
jgi:hypothetical protein